MKAASAVRRLNLAILSYYVLSAMLIFTSYDQSVLGYGVMVVTLYILYRGMPLCYQLYHPVIAPLASILLMLPYFNGMVALSLSSRSRGILVNPLTQQ